MERVRPDPLRRPFELWIPSGAVIATAMLTVGRAGSLPHLIATRWSTDGVARSASLRDVELSLGVLVVAIAAWGFYLAADRMPTVHGARSLVAIAHLSAVALAGQRARTILANVDVTHWTQATPTISAWVIAAAAGLAGSIGWRVSESRTGPTDDARA